jgi:3-methyladenine DNA glycosylase Tag
MKKLAFPAKVRCPYFELNDQERAYHDKEWGTPCRNDRKLFEYLHNPDNAKSDEWTAPTRTELSDRIAAELKARGFKFLGTVTIYAFMQSVGLVNDHARFCFRYKELTQ